VSNDPPENVARMLFRGERSFERRWIVPPNGVGPMVAAAPGERSKSMPPRNCEGKKAQE
jgi:hypothetical protein